MNLTIGWGDMEPREIERLRKALAQIAALATTHLEGTGSKRREISTTYYQATTSKRSLERIWSSICAAF
jgi:hypothetical protein